MNVAVLNFEVQEFIGKNLQSDISKLILKGSPFSDISIQEIAQQIIGKQKAKDKLPSWFETDQIFYPPKLNLEQTSSEITANYKSGLFQGNNCLDLTGGFGIDSYYFSKYFDRVVHCEINSELSQITEHNAQLLKAHSIEFNIGDGIEYLTKSNQQFDLIYADPSRRNKNKGKVFLLEDCLPNIPDNLNLLFEYSNHILLKYAPMLDIQKGIDGLKFVKTVHVVAVNNEVKELLFELEKGFNESIQINTVNFTKYEIQNFQFVKNKSIETVYSKPLSYLYEPNAAILKSGGFREIGNRYNLYKLHRHSHLYTSQELIDFPGRRFKIVETFDYNKKNTKHLQQSKYHVATRNFPLSVDEIRKKIKLKSGGDSYLFFTTDINDKLVVIKGKKTESH